MKRLGRWGCPLLMAAVLLASCGNDTGTALDDRALSEEVVEACQRTKDLHNEIISIANDMAAAEVEASETDRALLLSNGLDAMIDAAERGELAEGPAAMVEGLADRRSAVVAEMRLVAEEFAATRTLVTADDRGGVVTQVFAWGEKLMSETEPRLDVDASDDLVEVVTAEPTCQNVVQIR